MPLFSLYFCGVGQELLVIFRGCISLNCCSVLQVLKKMWFNLSSICFSQALTLQWLKLPAYQSCCFLLVSIESC